VRRGQAQDQSISGERASPAFVWGDGAGNVVWTDRRYLNNDIYAQVLGSDSVPSGANSRVNDDQSGSQQLEPDIAALPTGMSAVVWRDQRDDDGDIYLQLVSLDGDALSTGPKLNDDPYRAIQSHPAVAASALSGEMVVVWEDDREDWGVAGKKIVGRRVRAGGAPYGNSFLVNDDGTAQPKTEPDVDVAPDGSFAVVWSDGRNGSPRIYLQRYGLSGQELGPNKQVSNIWSSTADYHPNIGMRNDGSFVVSWVSIIDGRRAACFQRFDEDGSAEGNNALVALDTSLAHVLEAELFVHDTTGNFFVAVVDSQAAGVSVQVMGYELSGDLGWEALTVSDRAGSDYRGLNLAGDLSDAMLASWSDNSSGIRQSYQRLIHQFGYALGGEQATGGGNAKQICPVAVMMGGYHLTVWCDNRNPERGYDLYAGSVQYTSTAVTDDHEPVLPDEFGLLQNYPNPFNPTTTIDYSLQRGCNVKLEIFDILGTRVRSLVDGYKSAGFYSIEWSGLDQAGRRVASGVYLYRLSTDYGEKARKMMLLK
jgi:hypothetical protein